jgi:hypothetical protein
MFTDACVPYSLKFLLGVPCPVVQIYYFVCTQSVGKQIKK